MRKTVMLYSLLMILAISASAQKHELAVTAGGYIPIGSNLDVQPAAVVEGSYAHRLISVPFASVYAELPVAKTFDVGIGSGSGNYSALFVTPGLKLKLAPSFPVSPWFAVGGGVAHFSANQTLAGSGNDTVNSGALSVAGGIDMKIAPFISLRGQVRNYYTGGLKSIVSLPVSGLPSRQHNLLASGGLVLRF